MLLVDTSVWIAHLRHGDAPLVQALERGDVLTHPFVIGELACGSLRNRRSLLDELQRLPQATLAEHAEVLHLIERFQLAGTGIGWTDAHLLASARLSPASLYTHDAALERAWQRLRRA